MTFLIRVLTQEEAHDQDVGCNWWSREEEDGCGAVPLFRLATPHVLGSRVRPLLLV